MSVFFTKEGWRKIFRGNGTAIFSGGIIILLILLSLLAPLLAPYDPDAVNLDEAGLSPSSHHLFGTDEKGRDIFSRVIYGGRISLSIALLATFLALFIGIIVGVGAGYFGGMIDRFFQMIIDITLAFPSLLLAIGITVVLRPGFFSVLIALALVGWASLARLIRGEVLSIKEREFIEAARAGGSPCWRVIVKHLIPNCIPVIIIAASLKIGAFILGEAALSFLNLGVRPPTATWGFMISAGRGYLKSAPWIAVFPGLFLSAAVLSFNLLGDRLRDHLDPHKIYLRKRK